ncbi:MAG: hypothetical protein IJR53_01385 [Bacteroidales bacterium]|nr:hypothetical protein [Bacteroidales bacterium]
MKKNSFILLSLISFIALSLTSCKPDVQLTSDYRDMTVVYGLLNPKDQNHYIKIYKGYLTKDNALVWANELDNISYFDDIEVQLIEHRPSGEVRTYPMDTVMSVSKNYGVFSSPTQVLYRPVKNLTNHKPIDISEGCRYELVITNKKTGRKVTSETTTIANMAFNIPLGTSQSISTININRDDPWEVGFKVNSWPDNAYAVDAYVSFRYIEKNKLTGDTVHKSIDNVRVTPGFIAGNVASFKPNVIFKILQDNIAVNDNVWRYPDTYECIDIKLWTCDEVYYTYYQTAQPSSSIVQDRVKYTNIHADDDMALGFFASRTYYNRRFRIDVINQNEDSLAHGQWTKHLNFRPYTDLFN